MKSNVLNNKIGNPSGFEFNYPSLTKIQILEILSGLFEQLLIFDKVTICTNRLNFSLFFLIKNLGINIVEELLQKGYIDFIIWSPVIVTSGAAKLEKNMPPIIGGSLSSEDLDPEKNIQTALNMFEIHPDRKKIFTKIAVHNYIVPDGIEFSASSAQLVIDAYKNNNLQKLGLPYNKEPYKLSKNERMLLLKLGYNVIETGILSKFNMKSFENYENFQIYKSNLQNIGKAYNIANNTSTIFDLENLPNLKQVFISEKLKFESVFEIRDFAVSKYFRKWINEVGEKKDAIEISKEYLNQIKGSNSFFDSTEGKFLKNLGYFGASTVLGAQIAGTTGIMAGFTLGLLETYWIDNLLHGKNPSMFIDVIRERMI